MDEKENKRLYRRSAAAFEITYRVLEPFEAHLDLGGKEKAAIAGDLSEGGLALSTDYPLPVGGVVLLKFRLRDRIFQLKADIRYMALEQKHSYRVGVHFLNASADDRRILFSDPLAVFSKRSYGACNN